MALAKHIFWVNVRVSCVCVCEFVNATVRQLMYKLSERMYAVGLNRSKIYSVCSSLCLLGMFYIYFWEAMCWKTSQTQAKRDRYWDFTKFYKAAGAFQASKGICVQIFLCIIHFRYNSSIKIWMRSIIFTFFMSHMVYNNHITLATKLGTLTFHICANFIRFLQILQIIHPVEECSETLAFATEPVFASLANILAYQVKA